MTYDAQYLPEFTNFYGNSQYSVVKLFDCLKINSSGDNHLGRYSERRNLRTHRYYKAANNPCGAEDQAAADPFSHNLSWFWNHTWF
jgi:hypothetical protein